VRLLPSVLEVLAKHLINCQKSEDIFQIDLKSIANFFLSLFSRQRLACGHNTRPRRYFRPALTARPELANISEKNNTFVGAKKSPPEGAEGF
jgi:hypothetical protein